MVTSRIANSGFPRANLRITGIQFENCYCTFEMFFFCFDLVFFPENKTIKERYISLLSPC